MSHYCICPVCNVRFDRDKIQAVVYSARRYAHATCDPENKNFVKMPEPKPKTQDEKDLEVLKDYINTLYNGNANWALVTRQIKEYKEKNGYSYSGMLKSLVYFHQIKNNPIDKEKKGIGIIPFVYNDAKNYYFNVYMTTQKNESKSAAAYETVIKEVTIKVPEVKTPKPKLFNLDD